MVTQNVINGFVIPDDIAEIRDFPREFKISTVDFVYQRIAFLIECFPLRKEIIELAQSDNDCQKMKRKILKGENDLTIILAGNDGLTDTALDILSYLVIKADKTNPTLYQIVKKIDGESDKLFEKMFHENDLSKRTITRGFKAALDIFQAASVKDGDSIRKIVKDFDNSFSDSGTEAMMAFVKEAVSDIWDVATLGDMIYALRYDSDCNSWDMPEMADFFTQAVKNGVAPAPPLNMSSRPRIDMCMSSFRISTSIGVNHHSLYKFPITEKMKERICAIMAMSCTVDPRKMVHAQPDISYVDQCNLATCDALIANSDIVIFRVTQMSHSLYGKAKQICKARGIRFEHLPNVTSIPLTEELIYTLITKKEATGNE